MIAKWHERLTWSRTRALLFLVIVFFMVGALHAAAGLFLALATLLSILAIKRYALWKIALAVALAGPALLVREDALAMFPMIPITGFFYACLANPDWPTCVDFKKRRIVLSEMRRDPRFFPFCLARYFRVFGRRELVHRTCEVAACNALLVIRHSLHHNSRPRRSQREPAPDSDRS